MDWLKKLPNSVRSASGMEWDLWRKLPWILLLGSVVPLAAGVLLHVLSDAQDAEQLRWLQTMDYMVIGVLVFNWTAVLTLGIGCVVVMLMKGPGYVADPLELSDSDKPRATAEEP